MAKPKFLSLDGVRTLVQWAKDQLATKVDKVAGKDLSDNNYSDDDVAKLESIENGAQSNIIESISVNNVAQAIDDKNVNIAIPLVDDTLTNTGQSADAKATGDAIAELDQSLSQTATAIRQEFDDADNQLAQEMTQALEELSGTIPTKTSELTNDSDYTTKGYVDDEISGVEAAIPTKTSELTNDSDYTTKQYVDGELDTLEASIPTKVSQLQNDSSYATTTQLTDGLATKEDALQYGTATAGIIGKAMMPKTVSGGRVTSWQFGEAGKVDDVQINGTSILSNKVANIPKATQSKFGVVKSNTRGGVGVDDNGLLYIQEADRDTIKEGINPYAPIVTTNQQFSVFYGLAKAAGDSTQYLSSNAVGKYTDGAKTKIQAMLGVNEFDFSDRIAKGVDDDGNIVIGAIIEGNIQNNKASGVQSHAEGNTTIASGNDSHAEGAGTTASGGISHAEGQNTTASGDNSHAEGNTTIASGSNSHAEGGSAIASGSCAHAEGYGGTFTKNNVSYTSEAKGMADHTEGYQTRTASGQPGNHAEGFQTAAIGGTSHAEGWITIASGIVSHAEGYMTIASGSQSHAEGNSTTASETNSHAEGDSTIASGRCSHAEGFVTIANHKSQHVFGEYNIEDASENNAGNRGNYVEIVGNGTANNAKSNARTLDWNGNEILAGKLTVGAAPTNTMDVSTKGYVDTAIADAVGDITSFEFQVVTELPATGTKGIIYLRAHSHGDNDAYDEYIWVTDRYERLGTLDVDLSNYVTFDDIANASKAGVVKIGTAQDGIIIGDDGIIKIPVVNLTYYRNGNYSRVPVTIQMQHMSAFYGLAKASGDTTQNQSDNPIGTYTNEAKSAIQSMLGVPSEDDVVTDVQVNGTSVVTDGVAEIPVATRTIFGTVKVGDADTRNTSGTGVYIASNGVLCLNTANDSAVKQGVIGVASIAPSNQHKSTFYGLAKAAGDTTQSASANAVGTYTAEAKASIQNMLGIPEAVASAFQDGIEITVSGTTPTITANANTRYVCGEVTSLTFTPPSEGVTEVIFTAGDTVPTLTLPATVKMPEWFTIESGYTYAISIENATYGAVASWQT